MEDIEHFVKVMQQKRIAHQHELERLDVETDEQRKLMRELQDLRIEREQCKKNITKHINTITSHKHSIHKIVHSSQDIQGLPVPHDYAQDMTKMFIDIIEFLNNMGDIHKAFTNFKMSGTDSLKLIQAVKTCTEAVRNKLYQTKCSIAQLDTLKENVAALQQHILDRSEDESISLTIDGESTDSESTIT